MIYLVAFVAIHKLQDCVEISRDKELRTSWLVADRLSNALWGGGVEQRKIKAHHIPESTACHNLDTDDVRSVLILGLHRKGRRLFLK